MNSLEQAAKALAKQLWSVIDVDEADYIEAKSPIIAKHMEAFAREREKLKAVGRIVKHIESICDKCGHTTTEDGCAFCIKEQSRELQSTLEKRLADYNALEDYHKTTVDKCSKENRELLRDKEACALFLQSMAESPNINTNEQKSIKSFLEQSKNQSPAS